MRVLLIGHAPVWAAVLAYVVVAAVCGWLVFEILRHTDRERAEREQRRAQLDAWLADLAGHLVDLDDRLRAIEDYLFPPRPPEDPDR